MSCRPNYDPCLDGKLNQIGSYASVARQSAESATASATSAQSNATLVQNLYDDFSEKYLGSFDTPPVTTQEGALYFDTVANSLYVWDGANWVALPTGFNEFTNFSLSYTTPIPASELRTGSEYQIVALGSPATNWVAIGAASATVGERFTKNATAATGNGTANVTRDLNTRFADVVNVLDFGADPTGAIDSQPAIQAAIDYSGLFGYVEFPNGVYKISSPLNLPAISSATSGITLQGSGSTITASIPLSSFINISGDSVKISNFNFDSGASGSTSAVKCVIGNFNAGKSLNINNCSFSSFQNGLELSGQLYYISENFFLNCITAIHFSDSGMNSTITKNHILGSTYGINFKKVLQQVEGTRIIDNSIFCTAINGAAISFDSALECYIIGNIIDQTGEGTIGIYANVVGANTISRLKIISNWIAAGKNAYCCFFVNANDITLIANTIVENNLEIITAGAAFTNVNVLNLTNNNSLIQSALSGNDLVLVGCVNVSQFANSSFRGEVGFNNSAIFSDFTAPALLSNKGVFGGQSITGGGAAPTTTEPSGSIYMRTGAGVGARLYISQGGGSWLAVPGV